MGNSTTVGFTATSGGEPPTPPTPPLDISYIILGGLAAVFIFLIAWKVKKRQ